MRGLEANILLFFTILIIAKPPYIRTFNILTIPFNV